MSESTTTDGHGLIDDTVRIASWNVWGNFGPWRQRYPLIEAELGRAGPDIICLQEAWRAEGYDCADVLAKAFGYRQASAIGWFEPLKLESGAAILSRWEIVRSDVHRHPAEDRGTGALFQFAEIAGPRGPLLVFNAGPDTDEIRILTGKSAGYGDAILNPPLHPEPRRLPSPQPHTPTLAAPGSRRSSV